eukprot:scaffold54779_cov26-Tisochrysis_lutea.AAC.1
MANPMHVPALHPRPHRRCAKEQQQVAHSTIIGLHSAAETLRLFSLQAAAVGMLTSTIQHRAARALC